MTSCVPRGAGCRNEKRARRRARHTPGARVRERGKENACSRAPLSHLGVERARDRHQGAVERGEVVGVAEADAVPRDVERAAAPGAAADARRGRVDHRGVEESRVEAARERARGAGVWGKVGRREGRRRREEEEEEREGGDGRCQPGSTRTAREGERTLRPASYHAGGVCDLVARYDLQRPSGGEPGQGGAFADRARRGRGRVCAAACARSRSLFRGRASSSSRALSLFFLTGATTRTAPRGRARTCAACRCRGARPSRRRARALGGRAGDWGLSFIPDAVDDESTRLTPSVRVATAAATAALLNVQKPIAQPHLSGAGGRERGGGA